jgi:hypothetical protein
MRQTKRHSTRDPPRWFGSFDSDRRQSEKLISQYMRLEILFEKCQRGKDTKGDNKPYWLLGVPDVDREPRGKQCTIACAQPQCLRRGCIAVLCWTRDGL